MTEGLFFTQSKQTRSRYVKYLKVISSLSNLFSESKTPYLAYRCVENIFCYTFRADNLSRSDCSIDARKNKIGIGIKTFLNQNGKTFQKIAEFNKERQNYIVLEDKSDLIKYIAALRNKRLEFTQRAFQVNTMYYHCVARDMHGLLIFEMPMTYINIGNIVIQKSKATDASIFFNDDCYEYSFNLSKSTLFKRFNTPSSAYRINTDIIENPLEFLENVCNSKQNIFSRSNIENDQFIILPLYSPKNKEVPIASGLNQWNAHGRKRDYDEVYIPIPSWIHQIFKDFFPNRDTPFILILPTKEQLSAKICQDNSKALMSNPNKALGQWLLREVLDLKKGELLTYKYLEEIGIDSVRITKKTNNDFYIDFAEIGSYDLFYQNNRQCNALDKFV